MKRILLTIGAMLAGTSLASAEVLDGRWALFAESCTSGFADDIVTIDTVAGTIGFYESGCEMTALRRMGTFDGGWTAFLTCSGEGATWTDKVVFGFAESFAGGPNQLMLIYMSDGFAVLYQQCPE